jgi:hypothetical protein
VSDVPPGKVQEYADQAIAYVRRALGVTLELDSDTLPVLDHYLRGVPQDQTAATELIVVTAGAYFGEVVRRRLGGRWELAEDPRRWRVVLPAGISFAPAGMAASAIVQADLADLDTEIEAPPRMREHLQQALERMGQVSADDYYSLCGRLDTLEHVHEVLVSVAAAMLGEQASGDEGEGEGDDKGADEADGAAGAGADEHDPDAAVLGGATDRDLN